MCGIVGIIGDARNQITTATDILKHRGPDGFGVYEDQYISLGHRRLAIIDKSDAGRQPMLSENNRYVMVFNGEIYNYQELGRQLIGLGVKLKGTSDSEVLLKMYETYGEEMLPLLNGMYAFAIWDKEEKKLFLATDPFSIKPIYYHKGVDNFIFGSEIKSILKLETRAPEISYGHIRYYLSYLWSPGSDTLYKNIKKLEPGSFLKIEHNLKVDSAQWFALPIYSNKTLVSKRNATELVYEKLEKSVTRQMISDVPVGAFLSGGLDSSAIVAMAAKIDPAISCFTIEALGSKNSEVQQDFKYAQLVSKHLGVPLEAVQVSPKRLCDDLVRMISIMGEPVSDPALLNVLYISEAAQKKGIKVLLSGVGGDDLFCGYRRHMAVKHYELLSGVPKVFFNAASIFSGIINQNNSHQRRISKLIESVDLDVDQALINLITWCPQAEILNLISPRLKNEIRSSFEKDPIREFIHNLPSHSTSIDKMMAVDQRFFLTDHNLNYTDKMSMAAGVEVRVPFLDVELLRLADSLPSNLKIKGRHGKWILKKAMEKDLPKEVIYRKKIGFGMPLREWFRKDLKDFINDYLGEANLNKYDVFDSKKIHELISGNAQEKDNSYILFSILCIQIWLNHSSARSNNCERGFK